MDFNTKKGNILYGKMVTFYKIFFRNKKQCTGILVMFYE